MTVKVRSNPARAGTAGAAPVIGLVLATLLVLGPGCLQAGAAGAAGRPTQAGPGKIAAGCPDNQADRLAYVGEAHQLVTAVAPADGSSAATVEMWQRRGSCWGRVGGPWSGLVGENGFSGHHREGDGTTPTGLYAFGPVIYGNAPDPGTKYPYHRLVCGDWWDEDPTSPHYNTFQHVPCDRTPPFGGDSEPLWTETAAYPSFAVIEYNAHPAIAYAGSAIFLHADTGAPTTGCVSIPLADLDEVLRWLTPSQSPAIAMAPANKVSQF
jgi:L,D-peptidoglycan transpeptidase YkuD (ErfK/YbiS/YcfS/YnhG family)